VLERSGDACLKDETGENAEGGGGFKALWVGGASPECLRSRRVDKKAFFHGRREAREILNRGHEPQGDAQRERPGSGGKA